MFHSTLVNLTPLTQKTIYGINRKNSVYKYWILKKACTILDTASQVLIACAVMHTYTLRQPDIHTPFGGLFMAPQKSRKR